MTCLYQVHLIHTQMGGATSGRHPRHIQLDSLGPSRLLKIMTLEQFCPWQDHLFDLEEEEEASEAFGVRFRWYGCTSSKVKANNELFVSGDTVTRDVRSLPSLRYLWRKCSVTCTIFTAGQCLKPVMLGRFRNHTGHIWPYWYFELPLATRFERNIEVLWWSTLSFRPGRGRIVKKESCWTCRAMQDSRGSWRVQAAPKTRGSFELRRRREQDVDAIVEIKVGSWTAFLF